MKLDINNLRNVGQVVSRYRWKLVFAKFPIAGSAFVLPDDLDVRCMTMEIPSYEYSHQDIKIRQWQVGRNSQLKPKDITLEFFETTDGLVFDFFSSWQAVVHDIQSGKGNDKTISDAIISLTLLDNKNSPMREFVMNGCILKGYERSGLVGDSDEPMTAKVVLGMDYFSEIKVDPITGVIQAISGIAQQITGNVPDYLKF